MPYSTRFNAEQDWFEIEFFGLVSNEDIFDADEEVLASEHWAAGKRRLVTLNRRADISAFDLPTLQEELLPVLESTADRRGARQKAAWVVPEELAMAMVKVWENLPGKDAYEIFRAFSTEREARAWLKA